jgi:hypothetical protein
MYNQKLNEQLVPIILSTKQSFDFQKEPKLKAMQDNNQAVKS